MMTRGALVLVAVGVAAAISSCASTAGHLPVPEASAVNRLEVSRSGGDPEREFVIEDAKTVERFLSFLRRHKDGWYKPWDTFPTPQYSVSLKRDDKLVMVVWVGTNWIGGREGGDGAADNRLRSLSDRERAEILEILRIPRG
jgi:hypothetical protein